MVEVLSVFTSLHLQPSKRPPIINIASTVYTEIVGRSEEEKWKTKAAVVNLLLTFWPSVC